MRWFDVERQSSSRQTPPPRHDWVVAGRLTRTSARRRGGKGKIPPTPASLPSFQTPPLCSHPSSSAVPAILLFMPTTPFQFLHHPNCQNQPPPPPFLALSPPISFLYAPSPNTHPSVCLPFSPTNTRALDPLLF